MAQKGTFSEKKKDYWKVFWILQFKYISCSVFYPFLPIDIKGATLRHFRLTELPVNTGKLPSNHLNAIVDDLRMLQFLISWTNVIEIANFILTTGTGKKLIITYNVAYLNNSM